MKIGILTFHRPINYGAFLQAYALSHKLETCFPGIKIEIVDYIPPVERNKIILNVVRTLKHYGVSVAVKDIAKIRVFNSALKYLPLSDTYLCVNRLEQLFEYIDKEYNVLIIGSDAVFNWNQNGYPTAFIPQYNFKIPVVTYAASVHGLKYNEVAKDKIRESGKAFSKMDFIGVRDKNTEKFVKLCDDKLNPVHCCDPTFVMDFDGLYALPHRSVEQILTRYKVDNKKPYIVVMLEDTKIGYDIYNKFSEQYTVISLFKNNKYSDIFLYDLSPIEWALIIKRASLMVTNYFHGTLFALTQKVPAVVVDMSNYDEPYEGKLKDLMIRRFELSDLYVIHHEWNEKRNKIISNCEDGLKGKYKKNILEGIAKEQKSFFDFVSRLKKIFVL